MKTRLCRPHRHGSTPPPGVSPHLPRQVTRTSRAMTKGTHVALWDDSGHPWKPLTHQLADIGDAAGDSGGGDHGGAGEVGAGAWPLAALEIAVGGGDRPLPRCQHITAGGDAHGAAGLAPFEA